MEEDIRHDYQTMKQRVEPESPELPSRKFRSSLLRGSTLRQSLGLGDRKKNKDRDSSFGSIQEALEAGGPLVLDRSMRDHIEVRVLSR